MAGESSFVLANGLIVKNCDAFRYLLMCRARNGRTVRKQPQTYDERVLAHVKAKMQPRSRRPVHEVLGAI